jgi:hypothetical protein
MIDGLTKAFDELTLRPASTAALKTTFETSRWKMLRARKVNRYRRGLNVLERAV